MRTGRLPRRTLVQICDFAEPDGSDLKANSSQQSRPMLPKMARMWVEFSERPQRGLVGSHRWWSGRPGTKGWSALPPDRWSPPVHSVAGKGYPQIYLETGRTVLQFISTIEMLDMAEVLDRQLIDQATSSRRWYRKLPAELKAKHRRHRTASLLRRAALAYEREPPAIASARAGQRDPGSSTPSKVTSQIRL